MRAALGLEAVEQLRPLVPHGSTLAQLALRWILVFDGVTCTIPGARHEQQARDNARAAALPPPDEATMAAVQRVYDEYIRTCTITGNRPTSTSRADTRSDVRRFHRTASARRHRS